MAGRGGGDYLGVRPQVLGDVPQVVRVVRVSPLVEVS